MRKNVRLVAFAVALVLCGLAVREVLLSNVHAFTGDGPVSALRWLNGDQYRKYHVRNYDIFLNITESMMMYARAAGRFEGDQFQSMAEHFSPGMTFVDVGANKGDYSLFVAHLVGPAGRVYAVEPEPRNCGWIRKSTELNGLNNVDVLELALSSEDGVLDLYIAEASGWHSLISQPSVTDNTIQVGAARLDSLRAKENMRPVDGLKIDVEGAELEVLRGAADTISRDQPVIWMDVHPGVDTDAVFDFLASRGYRVFEGMDGTSELRSIAPVAQRVLARPRRPGDATAGRAQTGKPRLSAAR